MKNARYERRRMKDEGRKRIKDVTSLIPHPSSLIYLVLLLPFLSGCASVGSYAPGIPRHDVPGIYHKVEKGQTLWRIAKFYNVGIDEIVTFNRVPDAAKISEGQLLFIPGADKLAKLKIPSQFMPAGTEFIWPVKGKADNFFGSKVDGVKNKGIDIKAAGGAEVVASRSGRVVFYETKLKGLGKTVILDHGDGFSTVYANNSAILVEAGQAVKQGEAIARVGSSGRASQPNLHFQIRRNGRAENPFYYLP